MDPLRERDEAREPARVRAFFALELSPPVRAAASALARSLRERPGGTGVRWVRAESLHVTLRFLGMVTREHVTELVACVAVETGRIAPLRLRLAAARLFPSPWRPRVVALGIEPEAPLVALAAAVERGVQSAGFAPEPRRFRPHLSLGRIPPRADFPRVTAADTPAADAFDVHEVLLFRSDLQPDGARYTALDRVALGQPSGQA